MKKKRFIKEILLIFLVSFILSAKFNPLKAKADVCRCVFYSTDEVNRKAECYPYPSDIPDPSQPCFSWLQILNSNSSVYTGSNSSHQPFCGSYSDCGSMSLSERPSPETAPTVQQIQQPPAPPPTPSALENLQADLNARKPILEINIPGLNFSDVVSTTDETGTYFYIAWIPELISALYKFLLAIVSIVAVVIIIIQGIKVASGGFISKTVKEGGKDVVISAYKNIGRAIVGLMIAWGSFAILYNVNPALVQFNALKVQVVKEEELPNPIIEAEEDAVSPATIEPSTLPPGNYDSLFQKYANCVRINWQILKMIALGENSKLNPSKVNDAGFVGLFQTKPEFCVGKFTDKYAKYANMCTIENLQKPSFGVAVGALYQKNTIKLVNTYCKNGELALQLQIFYSVLNSGSAGTEAILQTAQKLGGCTEANVREGSRIFWRNRKGGASARWFIGYYENPDKNGKIRNPGYCQAFADKLDCMGIRKFEHTLKSAKKGIARLGITSFSAQSSGVCPLDTNNPFPSS